MPEEKSKFKSRIEATKSFVGLIRESAIIFVVLFLVFLPSQFNVIMQKAGFSKLDLGFASWENELMASTNKMKDANQFIAQYQNDLEEIKTSVKKLEDNPSLDQESREEINKINQKVELSVDASQQIRQDLENNITKQMQILDKIRPEGEREGGRWIIVSGADKKLEEARFEQERLLGKGYEDVRILLRERWYRTVIVFPNRESAENELPGLKRTFRESAFMVNADEWCPDPQPTDERGVFNCGGR
jgi:hypothetical protein